jgi:predicted transcriptional regulator
MDPINKSINIDAPLAEAIHKFVIWQARRIPVKSGNEIVGILRLTDVFNNVTLYLAGENK